METIVVAIIGVLGSVIAVYLDRNRRNSEADKNEAETIKMITEAAHSLIEPQTNRINVLERKFVLLEQENTILREKVEVLSRENEELRASNKQLSIKVDDLTIENSNLNKIVYSMKNSN